MATSSKPSLVNNRIVSTLEMKKPAKSDDDPSEQEEKLLCKHYYEIKDKTVKFREKLESIRLVTLQRDDDFDDDQGEKEKEKRGKNKQQRVDGLNTLEGIKLEREQLADELEILNKRAEEGKDVSQDFKRLENKLEILEELCALMLQKKSTLKDDKKLIANEASELKNVKNVPSSEVHKPLARPAARMAKSGNESQTISTVIIPLTPQKKSTTTSLNTKFEGAKVDSSAKKEVKIASNSRATQSKAIQKELSATTGAAAKTNVTNEEPSRVGEPISNRLLNPKIEVCMCFDSQNPLSSCAFELASQIEGNVSVAQLIWSSPNELKKFDFSKVGATLSGSIQHFNDVRDQIVSLAWSSDNQFDSLKLYVYFESLKDLCPKFIPDKTQDVIAKQGIHRMYVYSFMGDEMDKKKAIESLKRHVEGLKKRQLFVHLNNLKRCRVDKASSLESLFSGRGTSIMEPNNRHVEFSYIKQKYMKHYWHQMSADNYAEPETIEIVFVGNSSKSVSNFSRSQLGKFKSRPTKSIYLESLNNPDEETYLKIVDIFSTARSLADEFNRRVKLFLINVPQVFLLKPKSRSKSSAALAIEGIDGVPDLTSDMQDRQNERKLENEYLDAFSHFTYEYTKNQLLIIDLRTTFDSANQAFLYEPVIFSQKQSFGSSDLGPDGIKWFMKSHKCGVCQNYDFKCYQRLD